MSHGILVFHGSYRSDRIRLAQFVIEGLRGRGDDVELIDARAVGLPMLDRVERAFPRFADDLTGWMEAAKAQRARQKPPY